MSQIRAMYEVAPNFPATDQHPSAVRYPIEAGIFRFVDAVGGAPTAAEIQVHLNPPGPALSAKRARVRDVKKLEDAIAAGDQAAVNSLTLKLLKE